jgi:protein-S-isoprenylcysteine O-methyltransferase Ste14
VTIYGWLQLGALALFLALAVARAVSIRRRLRLNPLAIRPDNDWRRWWLEVSFFAAVNLWAVEVVLAAIPGEMSLLPAALGRVLADEPWLKQAGAALVVAGLGLDAAGLWALGGSWRLGVDERRPGELVTTGVYARTRNPIYLFFDLFFWGVFLINGTLGFLLFAVFAGANLHLQILDEERYLERVHGERYRQYRQAVGRYWTFRRVD